MPRHNPPRSINTGVARADIPLADDLLEKRLLEGAGDAPAEVGEFAPSRRPLPETFTEGDERRPNHIKCWHCMADFETAPVFIPLYFKRLPDGRIQMGVLGNFCTFNCAAGHIDLAYPRSSDMAHKHELYHNQLLYLYTMFTGRTVTHLSAAPHFSQLLRFGGRITAADHIRIMRDLDTANHKCFRSGRVTVRPDRVTAWSIEGIDGPNGPGGDGPNGPGGDGGGGGAKDGEDPGDHVSVASAVAAPARADETAAADGGCDDLPGLPDFDDDLPDFGDGDTEPEGTVFDDSERSGGGEKEALNDAVGEEDALYAELADDVSPKGSPDGLPDISDLL